MYKMCFSSGFKYDYDPYYYNNNYQMNYYRNEEEDEINPYEVLNIPFNATIMDSRFQYMKLATCPLRSIRRKAC